MSSRLKLTLAVAALSLALTACADGSTGPRSPGAVALATGSSGSGGGGGGGGGTGGGGGVVTPPSAVPTITSLTVKSSYGPYGNADGDLQASYVVDMGTSGIAPSIHVTMVDPRNGQVWWNSMSADLRATVGYRYLPLNLKLDITVEVLDPNGVVLTSKTITGTTPAAPKVRTT